MLQKLPLELVSHIGSFLPTRDRANLRATSKFWNEFALEHLVRLIKVGDIIHSPFFGFFVVLGFRPRGNGAEMVMGSPWLKDLDATKPCLKVSDVSDSDDVYIRGTWHPLNFYFFQNTVCYTIEIFKFQEFKVYTGELLIEPDTTKYCC